MVAKKRKRWEVAIPRFNDAKHNRVLQYLDVDRAPDDTFHEQDLAQSIQKLHAAYHLKEDITKLQDIFHHYSQNPESDPSAASIKADMLALEHEKGLLSDRLKQMNKTEVQETITTEAVILPTDPVDHVAMVDPVDAVVVSEPEPAVPSTDPLLVPNEVSAELVTIAPPASIDKVPAPSVDIPEASESTAQTPQEVAGTEAAVDNTIAAEPQDDSVHTSSTAAVSSYIVDPEDYVFDTETSSCGPESVFPLHMEGVANADPEASPPLIPRGQLISSYFNAEPFMALDEDPELPSMDCGFLDEPDASSPQPIHQFGMPAHLPLHHPSFLGPPPRHVHLSASSRHQVSSVHQAHLPHHSTGEPYHPPRITIPHPHQHQHLLMHHIPLHPRPARPHFGAAAAPRRPFLSPHQHLRPPAEHASDALQFQSPRPLGSHHQSFPPQSPLPYQHDEPAAADIVDSIAPPKPPPATPAAHLPFRRPLPVPFRSSVASVIGRPVPTARPFPRPGSNYHLPRVMAVPARSRSSIHSYRQQLQRLLLALPARQMTPYLLQAQRRLQLLAGQPPAARPSRFAPGVYSQCATLAPPTGNFRPPPVESLGTSRDPTNLDVTLDFIDGDQAEGWDGSEARPTEGT